MVNNIFVPATNEDGEKGYFVNEKDMEEGKFYSKEQLEAITKEKAKRDDKRHFSFTYMENIKEVISNLSTIHLGYLLQLQCHMEFGTGFLIGKDGTVMTKKVDIEHTLGITNSTNKRLCKVLENNGILEEIEGKYCINPTYHFRGQVQEKKVIKLFTTTLKQLCEVLKPAELGFLYKLLPYVHYETNMVCINPHEVDPTKIEFLNIKAIAQLVDMEEKKVSKLLTKLRKGLIVAEVRRQDKKNIFFVLNPYIFYRKSGKPDDTLRGMFAASPYTSKK